ncbi:MAG: EAL domain-containing protein [Desulfovibrionaceae bacterium]|nr:EAL domain-containing protein [Desulfovibrionaceae bacterium]
MNKRSESSPSLTLRDELIGLGERSSRKSFYPELKKRLSELELTSVLLDQAPDAILLMAWEKLSILGANAAALHLLAKPRDEVVGKSALDFFPMLGKTLDHADSQGGETLHLAEMIFTGGEVYEISLSRQTVKGQSYGMLMARDVTQRTRMQKELNQRLDELTLINEISYQSAASFSVDAAIQNIITSIGQAISPDLILFFVKKGDRLVLRAHDPKDASLSFEAFADHVTAECLCGAVAASGTALYSRDIATDPLCTRKECLGMGIRSAAVLPLRLFGEVRGVIALGSKTPRDFQVHGPFLESLAGILFTGLQNATLYEEARAHVDELGNTVRSLLEAERALKVSEGRLKLALEAANEGLWDWNVATGHVFYSPGYFRLLGYEPDALPPTYETWLSLLHPDDRDMARAREAEYLQGGMKGYESEYRLRARDGGWRWVLSRGKVVERDEAGRPVRVVGTHLDITARKEMEDRLRHMALHDALTGLANRTLCLERIERAVARAKRHTDAKFAVLFIDLDRFKVINDSLGHHFGDEVIIRIGDRIRRCVRETDTVARLGGDEFLVVLEDLDSGRIPVQAIKRIRQAICEPIVWEGRSIQVTASIGAELWAGLRADAQEVIRNADLAMHWAKAKGRNRFKVFTERLFRHAVTRMTLERDMNYGLQSGEFFLVFQPIVELGADGGQDRIRGLEALMRWRHPERGLISPAEFIPIAEETGKIRELTSLALTLACGTLAAWRSRLPGAADLYMAVNISAKDLLRSDLASMARHVLEVHGLPPDRLRLEVTETAVMQVGGASTALLAELTALGVRLSLDDFGTGYSSMSHLSRLPVDILKIDLGFVRMMDHGPRHLEIVKTIVDLAHNLGMRVVAEGVEHPRQRETLLGLGCEYCQGYLFARPAPADDMEALLAARL